MRYKATAGVLYIAIALLYTTIKLIGFIAIELVNYIYY